MLAPVIVQIPFQRGRRDIGPGASIRTGQGSGPVTVIICTSVSAVYKHAHRIGTGPAESGADLIRDGRSGGVVQRCDPARLLFEELGQFQRIKPVAGTVTVRPRIIIISNQQDPVPVRRDLLDGGPGSPGSAGCVRCHIDLVLPGSSHGNRRLGLARRCGGNRRNISWHP